MKGRCIISCLGALLIPCATIAQVKTDFTLKLSTNEIAAHTCSVAQTVALAGLSPDSVLSGVLRELQLASLGMARGLCKFLLSPQPIQPILWCATSPLLASRRELLL